MSLPTSNPGANGQSSIRSFFRPKQPAYAPPPSAATSQPSQTSSPAPPQLPTGAPDQASPPSPSNFPNSSSSNNGPLPPPPTLHPQASICAIEPEHVPALRRITSLLLPVNYPDSFYARLADPLSSGAFSRVVLWRDHDDNDDVASTPKVIGGLVCRPEPSPFYPSSPTPLGGTSIFQQQQQQRAAPSSPSAQPNALYIQSLVLLSPYRGLGLAAALLDDVTACAARSEFACEAVYAHVWTDNADGLRWYLARGFRQVEEIKGYYHKLRPDSAWVVRRDIRGTGGSGTTSAALGLGGSHSESNRDGGQNGTTAVPPPPPLLGRTSVTAAAANLKPLSTNPATLAPPPPPPRSGSSSGATTPTGMSYQNTRPETEWNDLPADMHVSRSTGTGNSSGNSLGVPGGSGSSSRSSSAGRKKRDRAYPAAAFGS
ncbi:acyl-CoA N-acyltransferase [Biscogniauxia sp. FL1348]|nr:acyl-CoA N-acyltransferase [Biscogniauxia sp. FL1348]